MEYQIKAINPDTGKFIIAGIMRFPDKVILTRYQKPAKGEEPKKVEYELSREQIDIVIKVIRKLWIGEELDTRYIAMGYSRAMALIIEIGKTFSQTGNNITC